MTTNTKTLDETTREHADAAGKLCTENETGCCTDCGVSMAACDCCAGIGYHAHGCAECVA